MKVVSFQSRVSYWGLLLCLLLSAAIQTHSAVRESWLGSQIAETRTIILTDVCRLELPPVPMLRTSTNREAVQGHGWCAAHHGKTTFEARGLTSTQRQQVNPWRLQEIHLLALRAGILNARFKKVICPAAHLRPLDTCQRKNPKMVLQFHVFDALWARVH